MAQHETRKKFTKTETIARRAKRAAKYASATMTNKSGRTARVAKSAY